MGIKQIILDLIEAELKDTDVFIVSTKSNEQESNIQVYLDSVEGLGIGQCAKISRRVSAQLDEMELENENYRFEISSPGVDRPLSDNRQYYKHIGRELEVLMINGETIEGELMAVEYGQLELEVSVDKKKKIKNKQIIEFKDIESSKVKISFKRIKK